MIVVIMMIVVSVRTITAEEIDSSIHSHHFVRVYVPVYHVQWDDDQIFGKSNSTLFPIERYL